MLGPREANQHFNARLTWKKIREKLKDEMEQQNRRFQIMVNSLVTENVDLKMRVQTAEQKLSNVEKSLADLRKEIEGLMTQN